MKKILYAFLIPALLLSACNDWLDVKPKDQIASDELFSTYSGFTSALNGCYMLLKGDDAYGDALTLRHVDCMANIWRVTSTNTTAYQLATFDYTKTEAETKIKAIYSALYHIIAQANKIIMSIEENGHVIEDPKMRAVIEGEAYAIRAFCHFDILRLFGPTPVNPTYTDDDGKTISLPFATKVSRTELPKNYEYDEFVKRVEESIDEALRLLENNDPAFNAALTSLNSGKDIFGGYRQFRFNYWAVKGLQARFLQYVARDANDLSRAYAIADEIIAAKGSDGKPIVTLGGIDMDAREPLKTIDIEQGYLQSPSECLVGLNIYDLMSDVPTFFGPTLESSKLSDNLLMLEHPDGGTVPLDDLFGTEGGSANNRYAKLWKTMQNGMNKSFDVLHKYYYNTAGSVSMTQNQVVPLIRLSEIYLIAIENAPTLQRAQELYAHYMYTHNVVGQLNDFTVLGREKLDEWLLAEYMREFYGEGQMFYCYKRHASATMKSWPLDKEVKEADYIVPLPISEVSSTTADNK